jgi:N-acetylglutamate synthase-like GNAT family acetyltransferase
VLQMIDPLLKRFEAGGELIERNGKIVHDSTREFHFAESPTVVAAFFNAAWKQALVAGCGGGVLRPRRQEFDEYP